MSTQTQARRKGLCTGVRVTGMQRISRLAYTYTECEAFMRWWESRCVDVDRRAGDIDAVDIEAGLYLYCM